MNIELKPCPFCGGEAHIRRTVDNRILEYYVSCFTCGAETSRVAYLGDAIKDIDAITKAVNYVTKSWNRRVSEENQEDEHDDE